MAKDTEFFNENYDYQTNLRFFLKLKRRTQASKAASVFDIWRLQAPLIGRKSLMKEAVKAAEGWEDKLPVGLRDKWLLEFLKLENLRSIGFDRLCHIETDLTMRNVIMCGSSCHNGEYWMKQSIGQVIANGSINSALDLKTNNEEFECLNVLNRVMFYTKT